MSGCAPRCLSCLAGEAGASDVHNGYPGGDGLWLVDLLAGEASAHDFLSEKGSFDRTVDLLVKARSEGRPVEVRTWLTRPNFRNLGTMPALLQELGVSTWHLHALQHVDDPALLPRLALAWPKALAAASKARALGIRVATRGAPHCVLGPMADLAADETVMSFGAKCASCSARARCCGVSKGYLQRFSDEDLRTQR